MDPLAIYPLEQPISRKTKLALVSVAALLGIAFMANGLRGGDADVTAFYVGGMVVAAAFPVVYWLLSRKPAVGGGDVVLLRDSLCVPLDTGHELVLDLSELEVDVGIESFGVDVGPIHYSLESGGAAQIHLRSNGNEVSLRRNQFVDEDHLRQLIEHLTVVASGGAPDGSAAFMARGFE